MLTISADDLAPIDMPITKKSRRLTQTLHTLNQTKLAIVDKARESAKRSGFFSVVKPSVLEAKLYHKIGGVVNHENSNLFFSKIPVDHSNLVKRTQETPAIDSCISPLSAL